MRVISRVGLVVGGVLAITIYTMGIAQYLLGRDPSPGLRVVQAATFVLTVAAAVALVVVLLGFFPQLIGRPGTRPGRLAAFSLRLSKRPRLLRWSYSLVVAGLIIVGSLLFGANQPGA